MGIGANIISAVLLTGFIDIYFQDSYDYYKLEGVPRCFACIPLSIRLHDGLKAAMEWEGASVSADSDVVQMVENSRPLIVMKAKKSCVAFGKPGPAGTAEDTRLKREPPCYYRTDLLWGQKLYQELRFVLVEMKGCRASQ